VPERSPSVLLVVEQLRRRVPGGIGSFARGLLGGLARCGGDGEGVTTTLLASRGPRAGDPLGAFGLPVVTSPWPGRLLTRAWDHRLAHAPEGFDVVHAVSLAAPPLHRGSPSRLAVTVHDVAWRRHPEATTRRGRRWHEAALVRANRDAAALVTPSRLVAADLAAWGVDPARVTIVPGGADQLPPPDSAATAALLGRVAVEGEFVLTVGTLEPRKNLGRLVQAYAQVRPSLPGPWPLVIVGPAGWGVAPPRHVEGVVFTGPVAAPVLAGLYGRARAFAYVPLTEGYGLPPLEAMREGTPALVSDQVPSVHDLGDDAPAPARLVDPLDVGEIAVGLAEVLTDEALRADLARRGAAHARARTWHDAARRYVTLWRSLA